MPSAPPNSKQHKSKQGMKIVKTRAEKGNQVSSIPNVYLSTTFHKEK
jgi:hypothetical protein